MRLGALSGSGQNEAEGATKLAGEGRRRGVEEGRENSLRSQAGGNAPRGEAARRGERYEEGRAQAMAPVAAVASRTRRARVVRLAQTPARKSRALLRGAP